MTISRTAHVGRWTTTLLFVMLACVLAACGDSATATPQPLTTSTLAGSTLGIVKSGKVKAIGTLAPTDKINFGVTLKIPNNADLNNIVNSNGTDPTKLGSMQTITGAQYQSTFAPSQQTIDAVKNWLTQNGVTVDSMTKDKLSLRLTATVQQVQDVFKVTMNKYQLTRTVQVQPTVSPKDIGTPRAATTPTTKDETIEFYANDKDVSIPQSLLQYILAVSLNNLPPTAQIASAGVSQQASGQPVMYSPDALRGAYNLGPFLQNGIDGSGQAIAIFAQNGFKMDDITQFAQELNLPAPDIEVISVDGTPPDPGSAADEVNLDIETVMMIAPKVKILVFEADFEQEGGFVEGLSAALDSVKQDGRAAIFSISYGGCEEALSPGSMQAFAQSIRVARAQGITIFAASGDSGAYGCVRLDKSNTDLSVLYPASDPNIVAVGGTTLEITGPSSLNEIAWSDQSDTSGTGGGVSAVFPAPTYQNSLNVSNSGKMRLVPDIAADADPRTGYPVYCTASPGCDDAPGWQAIGGTSAATPLWAAGTLLVNQYLSNKFTSSTNKFTPRLYGPPHIYLLQNAAGQLDAAKVPYRDITQGDNLYYKANSGYDLTTGWGVPNFVNMALELETLYRNAGFK